MYPAAEIILSGRIHKQGNERFTRPEYEYQKKYPRCEILSFALMKVRVAGVVTVFVDVQNTVAMIMLMHVFSLPVKAADAYKHVNQTESNK
jgi:hypothetical protein